MDYNLTAIKAEIVGNCKSIFDSSTNPIYAQFAPTFTFEDGVDVFFRVILFKTNIHKLDGLPKTLLPALQEAFVSRRGTLNPVKIIIEELEPFLKKLIFINSSLTIDHSNDSGKTLMPLIKELNLSQGVTSGTLPWFTEQNVVTFKSHDEFVYFIGSAYLTRNQVHNSPNWNMVELSTNLRDVLVTYLYATFKYFAVLKPAVAAVPLPSQTTTVSKTKVFEDPKLKPLYDFASYNYRTYEIRTEIVKSFILHFLSSQANKVKLDEIRNNCNAQFKTSTDTSFYERTLKDLVKKGKIKISGLHDDEFEIEVTEKDRIQKQKEFFSFQKEMFIYEVTEVLKKYGIQENVEDIIAQLTILFEKNYNIDIQQIIENGIETGENTPNLLLFFRFLQSLSAMSADSLLKDLMIVCSGNDFIHRVTAGSAFAEVSDLSEIEQYLRQQQRMVYLDSNVLLYALCCWYEQSRTYNNVYYKVAMDLVDYAAHEDNVRLHTTSNYVAEIAHHFKEALLLAPFDEMEFFISKEGARSNNVFYNFYVHLRDEQELDDNIRNFYDFLDQFGISEDLLDDDKRFISVVSSIITPILEGEYIGVEVISLPPYTIDSAFEDFKNSLKFPRSPEVINNDAKMICYLSDRTRHVTQPIYATWDMTFFDARKKFLTKHKGSQMWHLFTPSKLINHFQLLEFKINAESATNDYLAIIDNLKEKTKSTLDAVSDLLNINKEERRKYINKLKEFNQKFVFNFTEREDSSDESSFDQKPVEKLLVEINKHYTQKSTKYKDVKSVLENKNFFEKVVSIFELELEHYLKNKDFTTSLFPSIDALIQESNTASNTSTSDGIK